MRKIGVLVDSIGHLVRLRESNNLSFNVHHLFYSITATNGLQIREVITTNYWVTGGRSWDEPKLKIINSSILSWSFVVVSEYLLFVCIEDELGQQVVVALRLSLEQWISTQDRYSLIFVEAPVEPQQRIRREEVEVVRLVRVEQWFLEWSWWRWRRKLEQLPCKG